ncbi:MAG TPA: primosomal protein N' [Saprospiraceae bacterium]|nr:primosomal protein N' [Saprospiraceae bacterium]
MSNEQFHPINQTNTYVDVILPLALPQNYTYAVPEAWIPQAGFGKRVEVQFGKNRIYSGIIAEVHHQAPAKYDPKEIISVIDQAPIINQRQYKLWQWMAKYYCCSMGEIMNAALPANLKLSSETSVILSPLFDQNMGGLNDHEYLIAEALSIQNELSIADIQGILGQKTVYPLIRRMLDKKIVYLKEELKQKYQPKNIHCVRLMEPYASQKELINEAFEKVSRSEHQTNALMAYLQMIRQQEYIRRADLCKKANVDSSVIKALEKKEIVEIYEREISRIGSYEADKIDTLPLSEQQIRAFAEIKEQWEEKDVVLLHGVTGSGKTRVYIELIQEALARGEQVLYLLPEIALTTQIISRLQRIFGDDIAVYHSRLNNNERVELWQSVIDGQPIILGPRSALFLPYRKLQYIVVDEEHDPSYKQYDPNPRYHGRDAAIVAAMLHGAKVLLGTATPALESYYNAKQGKYGLVEMPERFGGIQLPETEIVDARKAHRDKKMHSIFTQDLLNAIKGILERDEQVILFQNRRGYAPTYRCVTCGNWHAECVHCDVSLTYHKYHNTLKCHYCGYTTTLPVSCPACGAKTLSLQGFGTQKVEDELKIFLPDASIQRMDYDTVKNKDGHAKIINKFQEGQIDILVGTQMVTKGLDFDKVGLVGILSADQILHFPDFRATERSFQLMVQVSGRAGRRGTRGKVLIQGYNVEHPVLGEVIDNKFQEFYKREVAERQEFKYPPFYRLIKISLKHKQPRVINDAAKLYGMLLKKGLGGRVQGPAMPYVSRVRGYYILDFMIKLEKDTKAIHRIKTIIMDAMYQLQSEKGFGGVRVNIDVDPY